MIDSLLRPRTLERIVLVLALLSTVIFAAAWAFGAPFQWSIAALLGSYFPYFLATRLRRSNPSVAARLEIAVVGLAVAALAGAVWQLLHL